MVRPARPISSIFRYDFLLKLRITYRKHLVNQQDFSFQMSRYGKRQTHVHPTRIAFNGRIDELLNFSERNNLIELATNLQLAHP